MGSKAVIAAFQAPLPPLSTTMLPFLYQTRTIAYRRVMGNRPAIPSGYASTISRRNFSRCAIRLSDNDPAKPQAPVEPEVDRFTFSPRTDPSPRSYQEENDENRFRRAAGSNNLGAEAENDANAEATSSFIRRIPSAKVRGASDKESVKLDIPWEETNNMEDKEFDPDESSEEYDDYYGEKDEIDTVYHGKEQLDALASKTDPRREGTSTITPSEKLAFQKIFSDIFARSRLPQRDDDDLASPDVVPRPEHAQKENAKARLGLIIDAAANGRLEEEKEIAVNRYPPALRTAAARAIGLEPEQKKKQEEAEEHDALEMENDKLEGLRKPERDRVEALMRAANTDFELWAVLEKEVFPLINMLGLKEADRPEEEAPAKKRGRKSKRKSPKQDSPPAEVEDTTPTTLSPVDEIPPLDIYGPLYPSYLLLALRLLDRSFTTPSPLTLNILPKIKASGIISHVLGASARLYNELLFIHWYRHDDFRGALALLKEMEQFGLDWDPETFSIVNDICKMQKVVLTGERGTTLKALWTLPEFAPDKFKFWRRKIALALGEREDPRVPF